MDRSKRILCAMMVCTLACTMVHAEENFPEPTTAPNEESIAESTTEPTEAPTMEPTAEPTVGPTEAPSMEPTFEPTLEPTEAPTVGPTAEPTATPAPAIEIEVEGEAQLVENVWQVSSQPPEDVLTFRWQSVDSATVYEVKVMDSSGNEISAAQVVDPLIMLPVSTFGAETYRMTVQAHAADAPLLRGEVSFVLIQGGFRPGGGFPGGGFPGGGFPGGGRPGGGMPGGSMPGGALPEEEQGFRVTPGEALTDSHASGTKDMQLYGTVEISPSAESMSVLTLDDTELSVTLDDQARGFYVEKSENALILTPETDGEKWSVNALALKVLNRSGIDLLRLNLGGDSVEVSTDWNPQGALCARLAAAGYVSKDYTLIVTREGIHVTVADQVYEIDELVGG